MASAIHSMNASASATETSKAYRPSSRRLIFSSVDGHRRLKERGTRRHGPRSRVVSGTARRSRTRSCWQPFPLPSPPMPGLASVTSALHVTILARDPAYWIAVHAPVARPRDRLHHVESVRSAVTLPCPAPRSPAVPYPDPDVSLMDPYAERTCPRDLTRSAGRRWWRTRTRLKQHHRRTVVAAKGPVPVPGARGRPARGWGAVGAMEPARGCLLPPCPAVNPHPLGTLRLRLQNV